MKKRYLGVMILLLGIITFVFYNSEVNPVIESNKNINNFSTNTLSINLETAAGSGVYEEATNSLWPSEGYTFNAELSKCENGSELSWDEANKKVIVSSNKSDKCYVYFDKEIIYLNNYIKSLYTTQGENHLYYHNGTIADAEGNIIDAEDGSYRYAGGDYQITEEYRKTYTTTADIIKYSSNALYLSYDTNATKYYKYDLIIAKAITDGYIESDFIENWVCFGSNESPCPHDNLYRIIGVFDSVIIDEHGNSTGSTEPRVKLIKDDAAGEDVLGMSTNALVVPAVFYKGNFESIPRYGWCKSSEDRSNIWSESILNTSALNGTYIEKLGKSWANKIASTEWKVGGNGWEKLYQIPSELYKNEIINPQPGEYGRNIVTYNAKVGLMYVSDYGFAASKENWTTTLENYSNDNIRNNNWLFFGGTEEITISRQSDNSNNAYIIRQYGPLSTNYVDGIYAVRPTFYLNPDVKLVGGTGTESDPYRID